MRIVRCTCSATSGSCVRTTIVTPVSLFTSRSVANRSLELCVSSSPVGSSARRTLGRFASAIATATRCCSPPESASGRWSARCASPTSSRSSRPRRSRSPPETPSSVIGSATFSAAVRYGRRFRAVCCHTKPTTFRRYWVRWCSVRNVRSIPATSTRPAVGVSTPPRMFWSVDLPLPEAPTTAISSPGSTTRSRPWSATTSSSAVL